MTLSLRSRIILTLVPLVFLLLAVGAGAIMLVHRLGGRIDAILRENFDSVQYMERLNEALERIDSSFQFALAGQEIKARGQYEPNWTTYRDSLAGEQANITLPGEGALVEQLTALTGRYRLQGDAFYARAMGDPARASDYFGAPAGLLDTFKELKAVAGAISRLNADAMVEADREARRTARQSVTALATALAAAVILAAFLGWRTIQGILGPIRAVTNSALAIGAGSLDQVVPVVSRDELGQLANAFNVMARQLRHFRKTDYARLLRAQRTSQATIDSFPDPVLVVDEAGRVELANPAAHALLGVVGRDADEPVLHPWDPPEPLRGPLAEALRLQRPFLPEDFDRALTLSARTGERVYLPRILPVHDPYGNTLGAAIVLLDVTRFRLLDQMKSDLVATVSHELKTPLTGLRLALHVLLEEAVGPLNVKQTELLVDARDNAERLLSRIDNLLDLARLELRPKSPQLRPTDPGELLHAAAEAARPGAEDKGIVLVVEVPADLPRVAADPQRLGRALANLLDNAITYTDRGGRISLSASAADQEVTLNVADTGRGIPVEHLPHVFERFFRVPGASKPGGTGLGLAIVREIANAHGGGVTCQSVPGQGTVFCLHLTQWVPGQANTAAGAI